MSSSVSASQYKDWTYNIARNMRNTPVTVGEKAAIRSCLKIFWDPKNRTGTRPWLDDEFKEKAVSYKSGNNYEGVIDSEPVYVLVEMLETLARDLDGPVIQDGDEVTAIDDLISSTGDRRYGTGDYYGGSSGSLIG